MSVQTSTRTLSTDVARVALIIFRERRAAIIRGFEDAAEAARLDRAAGYRAHYCVHGTNQWTDYDNICGPCEDGLTSVADYMPLERANAIHAARRYLADMESLTQALMTLARLGASDTVDVGAALDVIHARAGVPRRNGRNN